MNKRVATSAVVLGILAACGLAASMARSSPASTSPPPPIASASTSPEPPGRADLPPNHPPIGPGQRSPHGAFATSATDEAASLVWVAPASWPSAPNPSAMRIATYRIPRSAGDPDDAELSVTRAGGSADANIQRWIGQFDGSATQARTGQTVHGLHVSLVQISGTFLGGGMMQGAPPTPEPNWALLGAIVESAGSSYFFKLVGPAPTVRANRAAFDAMIAGLKGV